MDRVNITLKPPWFRLWKGLLALSPSAAQVVNWMPQNDVLGHPQTRAFLSQCGANSLYEVCSCAGFFLTLTFLSCVTEL